MALDALRGLCAQIPGWQTRLDELDEQVRQRQSELAAFESPGRPVTRSMTRNAESESSPIYYDGFVQSIFDELVRFISTNRNLMRRAKMASRVAQIKRLAEQDMKDDITKSDESRPQVRYTSTRRFESALKVQTSTDAMQATGPEMYDALDKNLEVIQSASELAAFQFLKDAYCTAEMNTIREKLQEVLQAAQAELNRVQAEDPELAQDLMDATKARTRRPISVRREIAPGTKDVTVSTTSIPSGPVDEPLLPAECAMEVDTAVTTTTPNGITLPPYRSTLQARP